jgi:VWFA-related protein
MEGPMGLLKLFSRLVLIFTILPFIVLPGRAVTAQAVLRLSIESVTSDKFPNVDVYLSVSDPQGFPVKGLAADAFSAAEDGKPLQNIQVSPVQNTLQPLAFVLCIDTSGSMKNGSPTPLDNAKAAAKDFISSLAPQDQVAVVSFSSTVATQQDLTGDRALVQAAIDRLTAEGNTALFDALVQSVSLLKIRSERRVIVLLTDGVDSGVSQYTFSQVMDEATRWSVPIYPIGFGAVDQKQLQQMAELTGGLAQIKPDASQLQAAFGSVLQVLREQYLLQFSSNLPADGAEHDLAVTVKALNGYAEQSRRFIASVGSVTVTLPNFSDGQDVGGKINFEPSILAPAPVASLDIQIDGQPLGSSIQPAPFAYEWDATNAPTGPHEFHLVAVDTAGNQGEMSISLNVRPPITVQITSPQEGDSLTGKKTVSADVSALYKVAKVDFLLDDKTLATVTDAPYQAEIDLGKVTPGAHVIRAVAQDINNYSGESKINVNVGLQTGGLLLGIALAVVLGASAIIIPLSVRKRRRLAQPAKPAAAPPAMAGQSALVELEGANPSQTWPISGEQVRLGRKREENDIPLKGLSASRRHALIHCKEGSYVIESLNLQNPVLVNDQPVAQPQPLHPGDIISAGESIFRFEIQG